MQCDLTHLLVQVSRVYGCMEENSWACIRQSWRSDYVLGAVSFVKKNEEKRQKKWAPLVCVRGRAEEKSRPRGVVRQKTIPPSRIPPFHPRAFR